MIKKYNYMKQKYNAIRLRALLCSCDLLYISKTNDAIILILCKANLTQTLKISYVALWPYTRQINNLCQLYQSIDVRMYCIYMNKMYSMWLKITAKTLKTATAVLHFGNKLHQWKNKWLFQCHCTPEQMQDNDSTSKHRMKTSTTLKRIKLYFKCMLSTNYHEVLISLFK